MLCLSGFELYPRWVPLINSSKVLAKEIKRDYSARTERNEAFAKPRTG